MHMRGSYPLLAVADSAVLPNHTRQCCMHNILTGLCGVVDTICARATGYAHLQQIHHVCHI
jgi:hypothetical protein